MTMLVGRRGCIRASFADGAVFKVRAGSWYGLENEKAFRAVSADGRVVTGHLIRSIRPTIR